VGLQGADVGDQDAEVLGLPKGQGGIRVLDVMPGEAAARAGIQVGDVILQFGSVVLSRDGALAGMRDAIRESRKQSRVPIRVLREGKEVLLEIVWQER
jgi:S1-C subfamily serine protease